MFSDRSISSSGIAPPCPTRSEVLDGRSPRPESLDLLRKNLQSSSLCYWATGGGPATVRTRANAMLSTIRMLMITNRVWRQSRRLRVGRDFDFATYQDLLCVYSSAWQAITLPTERLNRSARATTVFPAITERDYTTASRSRTKVAVQACGRPCVSEKSSACD